MNVPLLSSMAIIQTDQDETDRPMLFQYRLHGNQTTEPPPVLPDHVGMDANAWEDVWHQANALVQACNEDTSSCRRWLYPRLFPVALLLIGCIVGINLAFRTQNDDDSDDDLPKPDPWVAVLSFLLSYAMVSASSGWERRMDHARRQVCGQDLQQLVTPLGNDKLMVLLDYQTSPAHRILSTCGFYITLWLAPESPPEEDEQRKLASSSSCHERVLLHKGGWWRKFLQRFHDVPLIETPPGESALMHVPDSLRREDWQGFWDTLQEVQRHLRTFRCVPDGAPCFILPTLMVAFVLLQLRLYLWLGVWLAKDLVLATMVGYLEGKSNRRLLQSIAPRIAERKALAQRLQKEGVLTRYRVIVDYSHTNDFEEQHYVYIFITQPSPPASPYESV